jgi:hypothetical protein
MSIFKNAKVVGNDNPVNKGFSFKSKKKEEVKDEDQNVDSKQQDENVDEKVEQAKEEDKNTDNNNKENQKENEEGQEDELQKQASDEEGKNEELQEEQEVNSDVSKATEDVNKEVASEDKEDDDNKLDLPDDVREYAEYKKLNPELTYEKYQDIKTDWKDKDDDTVLKRYLKDKNPYFTDDDVKDELADFSYDEDVDDEKEIRKKKREKRRLLSEALNYLESQKETYKKPTEGSSDKVDVKVPDEYKQAKTKLSEIQESQKQQEKLIRERQQKFLDKTKSVFNEEFKGFEFDINGEKKVFKGGDANDLLNKQSDINNFVKPFMNEQGEIVDVKGYHKALHAGMNAEKIAKHFYELGQSEAIENEAKDSKNINFSGHRSAESPVVKKGVKMKVVEDDSNKVFGYKIRNRKKK